MLVGKVGSQRGLVSTVVGMLVCGGWPPRVGATLEGLQCCLRLPARCVETGVIWQGLWCPAEAACLLCVSGLGLLGSIPGLGEQVGQGANSGKHQDGMKG